MNLIAFILSWSPVLLLAVLAVGFKKPALELSIYGVVFTGILAHLAFRTPLSVILMAAVDRVATTLPLLLALPAVYAPA
jgi:lactate permease